jgi:hypothetical protein
MPGESVGRASFIRGQCINCVRAVEERARAHVTREIAALARWRDRAAVFTFSLPMPKKGDPFSWWSITVVLFKAVCVAAMIGTPLAGVWMASSLAAFANRATSLPVLAGLLLFPGLPLAWEGVAVLRERRRRIPKRRFLTFFDRLILRTLAVNFAFLVVLLAAFPARTFVALSARGDWMLDGRHGPAAERARSALFASAGALEWVYRASHDNPYRDHEQQKESHDVDPTPTPTATATSTSKPAATSSGTAPSPAPVPAPDVAGTRPRYPLPATLHPAVTSMPKEAETSIQSVGRWIAEHERDPMMRVKALHDYVADRIAYDGPNYVAGHIPHADGDAQTVFRTRVGVCAGYAQLLTALGKVTGDEILYVVGDARSQRSPMEGEGHAWNAAKIDGQWYLIDVTWDAGHLEGSAFVKKYSTEYLFTPPDQFAVTHFPDAPKWQLLEKPLSRTEFFRRPVLGPAFFAHDLELRSPDRSQVTVVDGVELVFGNPRNAWLLADYEPKSGGARTSCDGDRHRSMRCKFAAPGTYDVKLYVNDAQYGTYAYAGSIEVNARP